MVLVICVRGRDILQPIGVSANSRTVLLIISSGSEVMRVERMNHCLPAVGGVQGITSESWSPNGDNFIRTFCPQDLGDAILLVQECLLVHLVQQAAFTIPARNRLQVLQPFFLWPNITHLYHDKGVLVCGSSGEEHVRIEFPWCLLHTVTEVPDQGRSGCSVEPTVCVGYCQPYSYGERR